jgi:anti-sigma regulatory factor (Ser/Thr protein kinase)
VPDRIHLEVELARDSVAPGDARRALRNLCADHVEDDLLIDAELLVSELVTNALRHGRGDISLCARVDEECLRVDVIDAGSGFAHELHRSGDRVGGWGLDIVDVVSNRWGVQEGATRVWFELARPRPRLA